MFNQATSPNALQPAGRVRTRALTLCVAAASFVLVFAPPHTSAQSVAEGVGAGPSAQQQPAAAGPAVAQSASGAETAARRERRARVRAQGQAAKDADAAKAPTGSKTSTGAKTTTAAKTATGAKAASEGKGGAATKNEAATNDESVTKNKAAQKSEAAPTPDAAAKSRPAAAKSAPAAKSEPAVVADGAGSSKSEGEAKVEREADASAFNAESPAREGAEGLRAKIKEAKTEAERARLRRVLAERLAAEGKRDEAVAELRAALGAEHFDPAGFYNVGNALARLDESNAAVEAYRKAIGQRRGNYSRAQHNLGVVLVRLGRWEEALSALQSALRLEGNRYPEASYNLGRLHALRGEGGLAIDAWTRTLAHQPEHADAAVALARALAEDGDPEQGLSVLDAFARRFSSRGATAPRAVEVARGEIVAAGHVAQLSGGGRHATGASLAGAESSAANPSTLLRAPSLDRQTYDLLGRARAAREAERHEESAALYRQVIERRGGYFPPANLELGYSLTNLLRDPEAIDALEPVASKDGPRYPVAFYHLGRLYERTGQLARARDAFARAAALYGDDNPQILLDLSRVREKAGDVSGAAESMEAYVLATARLGGTPEWAREQLARLREKTAAAPNPQKQ